MNTILFRTVAPLLVMIMLVFAIYICLRGHNEPGGGFVGGLIAASAIGILGMAQGPRRARRALKFDPMALAGAGVALSALSGFASAFSAAPYMTGLWSTLDLGETEISLSTPMLFDIGVFLAVFGTISGIILALEHREEDA